MAISTHNWLPRRPGERASLPSLTGSLYPLLPCFCHLPSSTQWKHGPVTLAQSLGSAWTQALGVSPVRNEKKQETWKKADVPRGQTKWLCASTGGPGRLQRAGLGYGARPPRDQLTLLSHVLVQHQLAMPEEVEDGPEVGGVTVDEVGPGLILQR